MLRVELTVDGKAVWPRVEDRTLLVHLLREDRHLTGTHVAAIYRPVWRRPRRPYRRAGGEVVHRAGGPGVRQQRHHHRGHLEGRRTAPRWQAAFRDNHGLQCGYCTPGMIMFGNRHRQPQRRQARRGNRPARARRQYLPLHRLPQHRQGGARRGVPHEGRAGGRIAAAGHQLRSTPPDFDGNGGNSTISGREDRTWALKALAQAWCARKTSVSSPARAATSTTSSWSA